jgi:UDP-N-acetylglucosamine 1-carboxyvinyltransferase
MKEIIIEGGHTLKGKVKIGGAKNSAVALMPACLLSDSIVTLDNVPSISDRDALILIMELLGANITYGDNGTLIVDSTNVKNTIIPDDLSRKLRASYYFMGVLLGKYKHAEVYLPGGCNIGTRPIDLHLKGFEALGAKITRDGDKYILDADELKGCPINLDFASVGATINIMFAAVLATGTTTIMNAARETEIINIAELLNQMGANIEGAGTSTITINGVKKLHEARISVIPDRIEGGTYIIVGALIGEDFCVEGIIQEQLQSLFNKLDEMNIKYRIEGDKVYINHTDNILPVNVKTLVYPGFPTDLGQPIQVLLSQAKGTSYFEETIWENRMGHVRQLNKMGANIIENGSSATITGPTKFHGCEIAATDLRGGAALVLAGLIAEGITTITDADYILRGYEKIIQKLSSVGAKIKIVEI